MTESKPKKISIIIGTVFMAVMCVMSAVMPNGFTRLFSVHTLRAESNLDLAQFSGLVQVHNNSTYGNVRQIATFSADTTPMIDAYFINPALTGSAIRNGRNTDIPYMPPSGSDTSNWYLWVDRINGSATNEYTLYTANQDINGDIVYFPNAEGMTVDGNSEMDLQNHDFRIEIDGCFNPNSHSINNVIFSNNSFQLTYQDGLLSFNALDAISESQTLTIQGYPINYSTSTVGEGRSAVVSTNNAGVGYVTLVLVPITTNYAPTSSVTGHSNVGGSIFSVGSKYLANSTVINGSGAGTYSWTTYTVGGTVYRDEVAQWTQTVLEQYVLPTHWVQTDPANRTTWKTYMDKVIVVTLYNGNITSVTGVAPTTVTLTGAGQSIQTIYARGGNGITTATQRNTITGTPLTSTDGNGTGTTSITTKTEYENTVILNGGQTIQREVYPKVIKEITSNVNTRITHRPTYATTYDVTATAGGSVGVDSNGNLAYGLEYVYLNNSAVTASWAGGETTLVVERRGNNIRIFDELSPADDIISLTVASDQSVTTDAVNTWTFAENGAMPYLRSLKIYKDPSDSHMFDATTMVGGWQWNTGDTFTDLSGNHHDANPSFIGGANLNSNIHTTLSDYGSINSANITTTSRTQGGLVDTETPDSNINEQTDESKWKDVLFLGIFYDFAKDAGIPPSLFFVPLFALVAIFVHFLTYKFTRDMLISGIAGCAILGVGISLSVLYTFPLVIAILVMVVMLVKRKTISM